MKNFGKIISLVLLLSLVASVFAVLPAFADDTTELKPVTVIDMDSLSSILVSNKATVKRDGKDVSSPSLTKKTDENGEVYWLMETNVAAGQTIGNGSGAYLATSSKSSFLAPKESVVVLGGSSKGDKNTDFMVIDFDIATDDTFINFLDFHMRYGNADDKTSQDGNGYPRIQGSSYAELFVKSSKTDKNTWTHYSAEMITDEWVDVTIIYDFRGETQANWKCYVYFNGYYAGEISATKADAHYLQWLRLSFPGTATNDYESTKIRNLTYTKYPVGWAGDLTSGEIGRHSVTLDHISDVAFYDDGTNAPRFDGKTAIASIKRVGEDKPVEIYDVYDLDANFKDNDEVTILANIDMPIIVNANNVTFVNDGGYDLRLVDLSSITGGDASFDWSGVGYIALNSKNRTYKSHGTAEEFSTNALLTGKLAPATYVMLQDMAYDPEQKALLRTYTVYDLNGYTMTLNSVDRIFGSAGSGDLQGHNGMLRFQNGSLAYTTGTRDITNTAVECTITFQNLDLLNINPAGGVFVDHRAGLVLFKDIDEVKTSISSIVNIAPNSGYCGVVYDNVTYDGTQIPTTFSNRAANAHQYLTFKNSHITVTGNPVIYGYSRTAGGTVDINVIIDNSTLTTDNRIFRFDITGNADESTKILPKLTIIDSEITAQRIGYVNNTVDAAYTYDMDINIEGNKTLLDLGSGVFVKTKKLGTVTADVTVAEGVKTTSTIKTEDYMTLDLGGAEVAVDPAGGYIVTSEFDTYSYTDVKGKTQTFAWATASGAALDINKVELPAATGKYDAYRWVEEDGSYKVELIPNFNVAANLTLHKDISLNIFVDRVINVDDVKFTVLGADNVKVTEYEGKTKVQVIGINPPDIDTVYTIQVEVAGNGATVTKEIPISIASYCDSILEKAEEGSKLANLMNAILAYGEAADAYVAGTLTDTDVTYGEAKAPVETEAFENVTLNLNAGFIWEIEVAEGIESVIADYYYDGVAQNGVELAVKDGKVYVSLKAFDLDKDITLTVGEESITFNFAFYAEKALAEAENKANLAGMLDAIWTYATVAAAYKAN